MIESRRLNTKNINDFVDALSASNMYDQLNTERGCDPNESYNILHSIISNSINEYFPSKMIKFKKHKHKHSQWITRGIIKSIIYRDNLYINLKKLDIYSDNYQTVKMIFLNYNKLLKKNIKLAKKMYYFSCFEKCKNDIKST